MDEKLPEKCERCGCKLEANNRNSVPWPAKRGNDYGAWLCNHCVDTSLMEWEPDPNKRAIRIAIRAIDTTNA